MSTQEFQKPKELHDAFECVPGASFMNLVIPNSVRGHEAVINAIAFAKQLLSGQNGYFSIPVRVSIEGDPDVFVVVNYNTNPDIAFAEFAELLIKSKDDPTINLRRAFRDYESALSNLKENPSDPNLSQEVFKANYKLSLLLH